MPEMLNSDRTNGAVSGYHQQRVTRFRAASRALSKIHGGHQLGPGSSKVIVAWRPEAISSTSAVVFVSLTTRKRPRIVSPSPAVTTSSLLAVAMKAHRLLP